MDQRALLDAISTPDAAEYQNLHVPLKAAHQLLLTLRQLCRLVHLIPAALLFLRAAPEVAVIGKARGKSAGNIGRITLFCAPPFFFPPPFPPRRSHPVLKGTHADRKPCATS